MSAAQTTDSSLNGCDEPCNRRRDWVDVGSAKQLALYEADPNYSGRPVVYDFEDQEVEPQAILPGLRKDVGFAKRSFRKWKDDKGQVIEKAPRYKGATFYSKLILLPTDVHGKPLRLGNFQVMLHGSGSYIVCDWSKPLGENVVYVSSKGFRDACILCGMFHRWERWQGPLRRNQSRHKAVFGREAKPKPPPPPEAPDADDLGEDVILR
jgi:hypothetical protein